MKIRHIIPLLIIALTVLVVGFHAVSEHRRVYVRLAQDSDSRVLGLTKLELRDASGNELKDQRTEEFNRLLSRINERNEMRLSVAKYEAMVGPWILLGGLLTAYSGFLIYKLKVAARNEAQRATAGDAGNSKNRL